MPSIARLAGRVSNRDLGDRIARADVTGPVMPRILPRIALLVALFPACGRLGYDPIERPADGGDVAPPDADLAGLCDAADGRLRACYAFESDGRDGSGHGDDLVLQSTAFVAGRAGMALSREARSQVAAPSLTMLPPGPLTIELWVRADVVPTTGRAGLADKADQLGLFVYPGGELRCESGAAEARCPGLAAGAWRHVACAHDGIALRLHLDGVRCDEVAAAPLAPGDAPLHLGENSPEGTDALVGAIDSVRVWRVALSAEEICAAAGC